MLSTYCSIHLNNNLFNNKKGLQSTNCNPFSISITIPTHSVYQPLKIHPTHKQPSSNLCRRKQTHTLSVYFTIKKLHYFNISSILSHNSPNSFSSNLRVSITMRPFLSINTLRVIPADECAYLQKASLATSYANG